MGVPPDFRSMPSQGMPASCPRRGRVSGLPHLFIRPPVSVILAPGVFCFQMFPLRDCLPGSGSQNPSASGYPFFSFCINISINSCAVSTPYGVSGFKMSTDYADCAINGDTDYMAYVGDRLHMGTASVWEQAPCGDWFVTGTRSALGQPPCGDRLRAGGQPPSGDSLRRMRTGSAWEQAPRRG
jgi:hypothetical protein